MKLWNCCFLIVMVALFTWSAFAGETITWSGQNPWTQEGDAWKISYPGSNWPALNGKVSVKANSYYRISWLMSSSIQATTASVRLAIGAEMNYTPAFVASKAENEYDAYFYTGSLTTATLKFMPLPGEAKELVVKNWICSEVTSAMMEENLLPDGNFERAKEIPVLWQPDSKGGYAASVAADTNFISGQRSLKLDFSAGGSETKSGVVSTSLPVILGQKCILRFFARSDTEFTMNALVDCMFLPHNGKHAYKSVPCKLGKEWQEFTVEIDVPENLVDYPDLKSRLAAIRFDPATDQHGVALIDDVQFSPAKAGLK